MGQVFSSIKKVNAKLAPSTGKTIIVKSERTANGLSTSLVSLGLSFVNEGYGVLYLCSDGNREIQEKIKKFGGIGDEFKIISYINNLNDVKDIIRIDSYLYDIVIFDNVITTVYPLFTADIAEFSHEFNVLSLFGLKIQRPPINVDDEKMIDSEYQILDVVKTDSSIETYYQEVLINEINLKDFFKTNPE
jgi:hypothetical protein